MSTESERARALLASSEELLEQSRNRPRYVGSRLDDRPQQRAATVPVRKTRKDAAVSPNTGPDNMARWNAWAKGIAANVAQQRCLAVVDAIGKEFGPLLKAQQDRVAALVHRINDLEQRLNELELQSSGKVTSIGRAAA